MRVYKEALSVSTRKGTDICEFAQHGVIYNPADGKPRECFDCLLPGESQSPVIYNIKCSSELFG